MKARLFLILTTLCVSLFLVANTLVAATLWPYPTGASSRLGTGKITDQVVTAPSGDHVAVPSLNNIWIYSGSAGNYDNATARFDTGDMGDWFFSAAFNSDSTKVAGGTKTGKVLIANRSTGAILNRVAVANAAITSLAFSPDGTKFATGDSQGTITVWSLGTTPALLRTLTAAHADTVMGITFSPDSTKIASSGGDTYGDGTENAVRVWNVSNGTRLYNIHIGNTNTPQAHTGGVDDVSFSKDGDMLASASLDATVRIWKVSDGTHLHTLTHPGNVYSVSFSPATNSNVVTACADTKLRMWNASNGTFLYSPYTEHTQGVTSVDFGHDGSYYISSSGSVGGPTDGDSLFVKYSLGAGMPGYRYNHTNDVQCVAFNPNGTRLAGKSWDTYTRIYNHKTGEQVSARISDSDQQCSVSCVAYSPDGKKMLIVQNWSNVINVYDAEGKINLGVHLPTQRLTEHTDSIYSVAYSPDGTMFATVSRDRTVRVWDASTMTVTHTLTGHTDSVCGVSFSKDSKTLASGSYDTEIRLWNPSTGALIRTLKGHTGGACAIAFSPTVNNKLVSAGKGNDTTVRIWNTDTGKALHVLTPAGYVGEFNSVAFSRDGNTIAAASYDATVRLWNANTGAFISKLGGHAQNVASVAFSPTEDILASGSSDGTILLWDVSTSALAAPQLISQFPQVQETLNTEGVVAATALLANYPNPFNPETWIPYQLAEAADVNISIYSANGTLVRMLDLGTQAMGRYDSRARAAYWDGRNQAGEPVASGVYFYTLTAGEFAATRKMLILK